MDLNDKFNTEKYVGDLLMLCKIEGNFWIHESNFEKAKEALLSEFDEKELRLAQQASGYGACGLIDALFCSYFSSGGKHYDDDIIVGAKESRKAQVEAVRPALLGRLFRTLAPLSSTTPWTITITPNDPGIWPATRYHCSDKDRGVSVMQQCAQWVCTDLPPQYDRLTEELREITKWFQLGPDRRLSMCLPPHIWDHFVKISRRYVIACHSYEDVIKYANQNGIAITQSSARLILGRCKRFPDLEEVTRVLMEDTIYMSKVSLTNKDMDLLEKGKFSSYILSVFCDHHVLLGTRPSGMTEEIRVNPKAFRGNGVCYTNKKGKAFKEHRGY